MTLNQSAAKGVSSSSSRLPVGKRVADLSLESRGLGSGEDAQVVLIESSAFLDRVGSLKLSSDRFGVLIKLIRTW